MNEEPPHDRPNQGCGCLCGGIVLVIVLILIGLANQGGCGVQEKPRIIEASSRCRKIIMALHTYALEHGGVFPDRDMDTAPRSSNDVFRLLIKAGFIADERPFSGISSPYLGDNEIGNASNGFEAALEAGENHWNFVGGMKADSDGSKPLVFENSVNFDQWPPRWNCDKAGMAVEGRAWKGGKIIIGRNDGSIATEQLESTKGDEVGLKDEEKLFPAKHDGWRILDVEK